MQRAWLLVLALICACDADRPITADDQGVELDSDLPGDDLGLDGVDAGPLDGALPDAAPDMAAPDMAALRCLESGTTFEADVFGPSSQIHPAIAADGAGVWVVYNRVTPGGEVRTFDVWATRLGCNGRSSVLPFEVSVDPVNNDTDPAIAVGADGSALIVWSNDVQGADPNLIARVRLIGPDGTPRTDVQPITTQRDGAPFPGSQWMVQVARDGDGFVVVGARGVEARSAFQVFAQRYDANGAPVGETASAERDMTQQLDPDVAVAADGTVWLAWGEGDQGSGAVVAAPWTMDAELTSRPVLPAPAGSTRVATAGDRVFVLGHLTKRGGTDIAIREMDGDGSLELGAMGAIDIQPALAAQGDSARVAWFRRVQGNRAAVWTQRLDLTAGLDALGEPTQIETISPAAPYPMALAALADGRYVIAWTEGEAPAYRIKLRFLEP